MASINSCHLLGNLTRDPEVRYTPKGSAVCDLSIAINSVWYDDQNQKREETDFFDIVYGRRPPRTAASSSLKAFASTLKAASNKKLGRIKPPDKKIQSQSHCRQGDVY